MEELETEEFVGELAALRDFKEMVLHLLPDIFAGTYFICGEAGAKDQYNLPDAVYITPAYGIDWSVKYERVA